METRYKELETLINKFVRQLPETQDYADRLADCLLYTSPSPRDRG